MIHLPLFYDFQNVKEYFLENTPSLTIIVPSSQYADMNRAFFF